jgi:hypothetical protein
MTVNHDVVGSSPTAGVIDSCEAIFFLCSFFYILEKWLFYYGKRIVTNKIAIVGLRGADF